MNRTPTWILFLAAATSFLLVGSTTGSGYAGFFAMFVAMAGADMLVGKLRRMQ